MGIPEAVAMNTTAHADSMPTPSRVSVEDRKPKRERRIAGAIKHAATALYRSASSMMHGTSVSGFGSQTAETPRSTRRKSNGRKAKLAERRAANPGFAGLFPQQSAVERNSGQSSGRLTEQNPIPSRPGLDWYFSRRQRELGRPLTPEEYQSVINYYQIRERLVEFGLEHVTIRH